MPQIDGKFYAEDDGISKEDLVDWIDERVSGLPENPSLEDTDDLIFTENRGPITVGDLTDEMMQEFVETWSRWRNQMDELPDTAPRRQEEALRDLYYSIKPGTDSKGEVKEEVAAHERLQAIAKEYNGKYQTGYSGRGMMGKTCVAISCDEEYEIIAAARRAGITGDRVDNFGRGLIIYWPHIKGE